MGWEMLPPEQPIWVSRCCPKECVDKFSELEAENEQLREEIKILKYQSTQQAYEKLQAENMQLMVKCLSEKCETLSKIKAENERFRRAIQKFSDGLKYYDGETIKGINQKARRTIPIYSLRAALREVDDEND